ncbi:MAG: LON peptidase substrate-binding domain-containing protein, partial [Candidatus Thorarchaeota archaeon]
MEIAVKKEQPESIDIPKEMPILPVKGTVVFPYLVIPLIITEKSHTRLVDEALTQGKTVGIFNTRDADIKDPGFDDIHWSGTAGNILKLLRFPDGSVRFLIQGLSRIQIVRPISTTPYLTAEIEPIDEQYSSSVKT